MTKQDQEMAQKVAEFIIHNSIDLSQHTMDEIVAGFIKAQSVALSKAAQQVEDALMAQLAAK